MLLRLLLLLLAVLPLPAGAQVAASQDVAGTWLLRVEGTAIFRFDIARDGDNWRGTWARPSSFASDGTNFGRLAGPAVEVRSQASRTMGEWAELTFPDPRPNAVNDIFRFRVRGPDRLEMLYADTGLPAYELVRVAPGTAIGPWEANRMYRQTPVAAVGLPSVARPPATPVPARTTIPTAGPAQAAPTPGRPAQPVASAAPPPLSGRDAGSRIWSQPAKVVEPTSPAMPSGR